MSKTKLLLNVVEDVRSLINSYQTLAEHKLRKLLGQKTSKSNSKFIDKDMEQYTDDYANYIHEVLQTIRLATKDPIVLIEQRLDFSNYVPDGLEQETV